MKLYKLNSIILVAMLLCACVPISKPEQTATVLAGVYTSMAETYSVDSTLRVPTTTFSLQPSETPTQTDTPAPVVWYPVYEVETTEPPEVTPTTPCFAAEHMSDITIPDGTVMYPGTAFTKTWRIKNTGTCEWTPLFALDFCSGEQMGGTPVQINTTVKSGESIIISVPLVAPAEEGNYVANWCMRNETWDHFEQVVFLMITTDFDKITATPTQ